MASDLVAVGTDSSVLFGTSGWAPQLLNVSLGGMSREAISTTHMKTPIPTGGSTNWGGQTFIPAKLANPGQLSMEVHFNPDDDPPINEDPELITVSFPGSASWAHNGFMTDFSYGDPVDGLMTGTAEIQLTGFVTPTDG